MARVSVPTDGVWAGARHVIATLRAAGHETWAAGGAVRDLLLGRAIHDVDVATAAPPELVEQLFPRTIAVGKSFGVIIVPLAEGGRIEVATFRADGLYVDGRRPTTIRFASAAEDVARRDLTINALLLDPDSGDILDLVGGCADLEKGLVRAVGDAAARLSEDRLRVLRTLRFAAQLDFTIEAQTWAAVCTTDIRGLSAERIVEEWRRALTGSGAAAQRWAKLLTTSGRLTEAFPMLAGVDEWPGLSDLREDDSEAVRLAVWLAPGSGSPAWLARQPLARNLVETITWLLHQLAPQPWDQDLRGAVAQRILRTDLRATALARLRALVRPSGPQLQSEVERAKALGPFQPWLKAADVLARGVPPGPRLGALLRQGEDLQLVGTWPDSAAAQAWLVTQTGAPAG